MKKSLRLAGAWAMAVAWLAMGIVSRTHAQTAVSNSVVAANLNGAASFAIPSTTFGGAFTMEGWVYPVGHGSWQRIVEIAASATVWSDTLFLGASSGTTGQPVFSARSNGTLLGEITSPSALPLNTWTHVAGVLADDRSMRLYVNGVQVASTTVSALPQNIARTSSFIGKSNWSVDALLNGAVADVRIWNVGRTQTQITNSMPVGSVTGATTGLLAAYPFGATGATGLADVSGNGYTLTQSGVVNFSKFMSGTLETAGYRGTSSVGVAGGSLVIIGANNDYTGNTTVSSGATLGLKGSGTFASTPTITVAAGGTFDVSAMATAVTLGASQTLASSGANAALRGNLDATVSTLSMVTDATTPGFTISAGTLTVGANTVLRVNKTGSALAAGVYKVVSKGTGGTVAGSAPLAVVMDGSGIPMGTAATAEITGGELFVRVAATPTTSPASNAVGPSLNGTTASFSMPSTTFGGAVTVEGWVYPRSHALWQRLVDIGNGQGSDNVLFTASNGTTGRPEFQIYSGSSVIGLISAPNAIPLNTWTHIAGVVGNDLSMRMYINGQLVATSTASALPRNIARTSGLIGRSNWSVDSLFNGGLADIRIWTTARSQAQILASMGIGSITGPTTGLLAAYPFGATGATGLADVSGNGYTLTQSGAVTFAKWMSGTLETAGFRGNSSVNVGAGSLVITGANNDYTGNTTVDSGATLGLKGSGTLASTPTITLFSGGAFDVSAMTAPVALGASQTLASSGTNAIIRGNLDATASTLSMATDGSMPGFTVAAGTLTVGTNTILRINKTGSALAAGVYRFASKDTGGTVAGAAPLAVIVEGGGIPMGTVATAEITGGELFVRVAGAQVTSFSSNVVSANLNLVANFAMPTTTFGGGPLTAEAWVYPRTHYSWQRIFDIGNGAGSDNIILAASWQTTGTPTFQVYSGGTVVGQVIAPTAIPLNTWSHVAGVIGSDYFLRLYVNGQLVATSTGPASAFARNIARASGLIGDDNWATTTDGQLNGSVADARIWTVARSQADILRSMAVGSVAGPTTGLFAAYPFGATGASVLADVSGNGLGLTQVGTPQFEKLGGGTVATSGLQNRASLVVSGGTLALTGTNTFTNGVTVGAGTFSVGNGGDSGNPGFGNVVNTGSLLFNRTGQLVVSNLISGWGTLTQSGPGTTVLTATNTYTGITTVTGGTLQVGNGGAAGSLGTADVVNNATLAFNRSDAVTYGNVISGTGALIKDGAGSLTLMGANTYSGGTIVTNGRLQVGSGGTAGALGGGPIVNNATLAWRRSDAVVVPGAISGSGALAHEGTGTLTLLGSNTYTGTLTANAGNLVVGNGGDSGSLGQGAVAVSGNLTINRSGQVIIPGTISGTGSLTKAGAGTAILTGAGTYTGVTTISGGTLQVGNGGASGSLGTANVVNNGTMAFNRSDNVTVANVISGSGSLVQSGAGTLTIAGANTFTGPVTVSAGTLALSANGSLGGTPGIAFSGNAALDVTARASGLNFSLGQGISVASGTATLRGTFLMGSGRISVVAGATAPIRVASGSLAVSSGTTMEVMAMGTPLPVGAYKLIAKDGSGAVTGTAPTLSVTGAGVAPGMQAFLLVVSDELILYVKQPVAIALGNLSPTYDGKPKAASVTVTPADAPVAVTYNGSATPPTEPGSYAVVATVVNTDTQAGTATGTLVINKMQATVTVGTVVYTYDGTQPRVAATTVPPNLKVTYTFDGKPTVPVYVGRYAIEATIDDPYYQGTGTGRLTILAGNAGKGPPPNPLPPGFLTYQGFLTDIDGKPMNATSPANVRLVFRMYESPVGGSPVWAEEQVALVDAGQFSVVLGEGNATGRDPWPPLLSVFTSGTTSRRYMQVTAVGQGAGGADQTILPRVLLPPVPYAFLAKHALTAERLVNSSNQTVLNVTGQAVGILQSSPAATLDVGGGAAATTIKASGSIRVGGTLKASKVSGRGFIPVGGIVPWSGTTLPSGWVLCDGRITNSVQTPDLRGRFVVGVGSGQGLAPRLLGQVGGSETASLTLAQMPSHRHVMDPAPMEVVSDGAHDHSYESAWLSVVLVNDVPWADRTDPNSESTRKTGINPTANSTWQSGGHVHEVKLGTMQTTFTGEGQPHGVMPPFYVLAYIMRIQ